MRFTLLLCAAALVGCGSGGSDGVDTGPVGPPVVAFADPPSGDGPQCVSTGGIADAEIPLLVSTEELTLRPPLACFELEQCGHLELYVDGVFNNEGAVPAISLLLRRLADPIHDGSIDEGTGEADVLRVRVQAVDDNGELYTVEVEQEDGSTISEPVADEVELITVPDCAEL